MCGYSFNMLSGFVTKNSFFSYRDTTRSREPEPTGAWSVAAIALVIAALAAGVGCGPGAPSTPDVDANPGGPDAMQSADAAPRPDARPALPTTHLLITEVALTPTDQEFIEIFNPGDDPVDLSDYYLSDVRVYAQLPGAFGGTTGAPAIDVNQADFIARFPDQASIGPGEVRVIAMKFDTFTIGTANYGITGALQASEQMRDPSTTQLISNNPTLTSNGEGIVLFTWDRLSDLVKDIDMVHAGVPSGGNLFTAKTSTLVDGPDADASPNSYRTDMLTLGNTGDKHDAGDSQKRIALEDGAELQNMLGNGLLGHDETSENLAMTWDNGSTVPFTPADPGTVPAALRGQ